MNIIGQAAMEAYFTVFDRARRRVGFAPIAGCPADSLSSTHLSCAVPPPTPPPASLPSSVAHGLTKRGIALTVGVPLGVLLLAAVVGLALQQRIIRKLAADTPTLLKAGSHNTLQVAGVL